MGPMTKTFVLRDQAVLDRCVAYLRSIFGGEELWAVLIVPADKKRTLEQNDKLHKMFRDLSEEAMLNGRRGTPMAWKAWCLVSLGYADTYTDLATGELVAAPASTSNMSVKQMSELIEGVHRLAAEELGVEL